MSGVEKKKMYLHLHVYLRTERINTVSSGTRAQQQRWLTGCAPVKGEKAEEKKVTSRP